LNACLILGDPISIDRMAARLKLPLESFFSVTRMEIKTADGR